MTAKKGARRTKSPAKTPVLKVQQHGGALLVGGMPGNAGGGRPPSVVKQLAAEKLPKHITTLDNIADGKTFIEILGKCSKCGHQPPEQAFLAPAEVKAGERVRAVEVLAKLADSKELVIASDAAAAFFDCISTAITELYGAPAAEAVKARAIQLVEAKA